jgi:hypothetical protein
MMLSLRLRWGIHIRWSGVACEGRRWRDMNKTRKFGMRKMNIGPRLMVVGLHKRTEILMAIEIYMMKETLV